MAANPNSGDFYNRGEPFEFLKGKVDNTTADYYNRGEPFSGIVPVTVTTRVKDMLKSGMVIPFNR